jgi:hypothetical protein
MSEFFSTEATNLLSFICRSMPNLRKSILEQSTPVPQKPNTPTLDFFTASQIQEACEHPTAYVKQAIGAISAIQNAIFAATQQLETRVQQREVIERALAASIKQERIARQAAKEKEGK